MMKTVAVVGTFDTKGEEFQYLIQKLKEHELDILTIDLGTKQTETIIPDYRICSNIENYDTSIEKKELMDFISKEAELLILELIEQNKIQGIVSMGGGQGTFLAREIFKELPIGFPKVLLSTIALLKDSAEQFTELNDTMVVNSLVDIAGLNSVLKVGIEKTAGAIWGMVFDSKSKEPQNKLAVGISCWGVTTPCVNEVRRILEEKGYEVYVFHANTEGGALLEKFIQQGLLCGVADLTLSEITMPLVGSYQENVPERLENAGKYQVPIVVVPGGVDMILKRKEDVKNIVDRKVYYHTPEIAFVRSTPEENKMFAEVICEKLNRYPGDTTVILPLQGVSMVDKKKNIFYDPKADKVLFETLHKLLSSDIMVIEMNCHINDTEFAGKVADVLLHKMKGVQDAIA